jgi:anti-sigma B factor antagonist
LASIAERVALEGRCRLRGSATVGGFAYLTGSRDCLLIEAPFDQEISMSQVPVASSVATPMPFKIAERRVGRRTVLSVGGEVDISTAADLRWAIETAAARASEVWVDLSETTFMDSSGLHAMARARDRLADANLRLVLVSPAAPVLRVLELTGFDLIFEIDGSRGDGNA